MFQLFSSKSSTSGSCPLSSSSSSPSSSPSSSSCSLPSFWGSCQNRPPAVFPQWQREAHESSHLHPGPRLHSSSLLVSPSLADSWGTAPWKACARPRAQAHVPTDGRSHPALSERSLQSLSSRGRPRDLLPDHGRCWVSGSRSAAVALRAGPFPHHSFHFNT